MTGRGDATRRALVTVLAALTLLAACASDDVPADGSSAPTTEPATTAATPPTDGSETAAGGWEQVSAPSTCRCSDGSPYHYWIRRADPQRVLFFLEGGGACFSAATCGPESPTFKVNLTGDLPEADQGIFAFDDDRNPFASWSMVYVPYCTGDLHLGDATRDYGDGVVIQHNGSVNASTALAAMATAFPDADEVVVAGASAGSASAPLYGGLAHDAIPDARITVVADGSGAYPGDEGITSAIGSLWGVTNRLPAWPSSEGAPDSAWSLPGLFVQAGRHVPDITMATINNAYDDVQAGFSALIGSTGDLRDKILANDEWIEAEGIEVRSWVTPGTGHTIIARPELYDTEVDGTALHEWLAALVAGDDVPDVRCTECR